MKKEKKWQKYEEGQTTVRTNIVTAGQTNKQTADRHPDRLRSGF